MKEKAFRTGMWLVMLLGLAATVFILNFTIPYANVDSLQKNAFNILLFYVAIGFFFTGFFTLSLFWIRRRSISEEDVRQIHIGVSLREGLLLAIAVIAVLALQSFRVLVWWDALLAVGAIMMIELYFLAR